MIINELYSSVSGEGPNQGKLCTFIRFAGCNLKCSYCDTIYAQDPRAGTEMSISSIVNKCKEFRNKRIVLTGGEPLIQEDLKYLLFALLEEGNFKVEIETNGSITPFYHDNNLTYIMDFKCTSSGQNLKMNSSAFRNLSNQYIIKFVVQDEKDLRQILDYKKQRQTTPQIYISPVYGKISLEEIVDFMKEHNLQDCKLQTQLHKQIYGPDRRGV